MKSDGVVRLRRLRVADAEAFAALSSDPEAVQWSNGSPDYSAADAALFIAGDAEKGWESGKTLRWAVADDDSDALLGTVALHRVHAGGAELGIKLASGSRGTGVALRAVELVLDYAFNERDLSVVHWYAKVGNWASRKLAHRAGFSLQGTVRLLADDGDGRADCWILTMTTFDHRRISGPSGEPQTGNLEVTAVVPELSDGTVVLRRLGERDVAALTENCQDPAAVKWTSVPEGYTEQDARDYIFTHVPGAWESGEQQNFAIARAEDGQLLGTIGLHRFRPGTAEVGINMGPESRGSGAAEWAARLLIGYALDQLNLQYLHWQAGVPNWASRKLAWKLGFRHEATIRGYFVQRGVPTDAWIMTLAADDPRSPCEPWMGP
ncbi:GNAT family N-acetyltransferase [Arthrobacter sp. H14]|uniref:GNAT family N-acetyltransferase n=1 Tax=Arthrobacter sp. H14 TaxID=1312959 RepID=UPI0004BC67FB|nr:GNAT family N-acetyltransferase [Arthrobacter sp. H14]